MSLFLTGTDGLVPVSEVEMRRGHFLCNLREIAILFPADRPWSRFRKRFFSLLAANSACYGSLRGSQPDRTHVDRVEGYAGFWVRAKEFTYRYA